MRHSRLLIVAASLTTVGVGLPRVQSQLQPNAPVADSGVVKVTSTPTGLRVFATHHDRPNPNVISRSGVVDETARGVSPLELKLEAGTHTIAIERVFAPGAAEMNDVPRGCIGNFSFSGGSVFFKCFKCRNYPAGAQTDSIDPYQRDGNIGVCFDAPTEVDQPIRYFRLYSVVVDSVSRSVNARFLPKQRRGAK